MCIARRVVDTVTAFPAEKFRADGIKDGSSCIEQISNVYGRQAVVISVDPKRVYVNSKEETPHEVLEVEGGKLCWWQVISLCHLMCGRACVHAGGRLLMLLPRLEPRGTDSSASCFRAHCPATA